MHALHTSFFVVFFFKPRTQLLRQSWPDVELAARRTAHFVKRVDVFRDTLYIVPTCYYPNTKAYHTYFVFWHPAIINYVVRRTYCYEFFFSSRFFPFASDTAIRGYFRTHQVLKTLYTAAESGRDASNRGH